MGYMTRRIEHLLNLFENDKIEISKTFAKADDRKKLISDLSKIKRQENGEIELSTCSPLVKTLAKAVFAMEYYEPKYISPDYLLEKTDSEPDINKTKLIMRQYFEILENFINEVTGKSADEFVFEDFREKALSGTINLDSARHAYEVYPNKISKFYSRHSKLIYSTSKSMGGLKLVLGGGAGFNQSTLESIRKMVLYADTILIPDPLMPYLEVHRKEEEFRLINFLRYAQKLLLLKPLVNAELSHPAIIIFPSWEKILEHNDVQTKDGLSHLIIGFFSSCLEPEFEDEEQIIDYIEDFGKSEFENKVTELGLFWPPESSGPLPFSEAAKHYRTWLKTWRSEYWQNYMLDRSPHFLVLNGIIERLAPHYHVRENVNSLNAQPMYWLSPHFHYFQLISSMNNLNVLENQIISQNTFSTLKCLLEPDFAWLGNIPIPQLALLREENANAEFRSKLANYTNQLSSANLSEIDNVTDSVMRAINSLIEEHNRNAEKIADNLERKLSRNLIGSILTTGVVMYPWLESWLGLSILGPSIKSIYDLLDYRREKSKLSRSLLGVLSEAHPNQTT